MVGLAIPIERENQKQSVVEAGAWASWGAAVLRPYMILLGGEGSMVLTSEILRFAQDDSAIGLTVR